MNTHKPSILSKNHHFWLHVRHLIFGGNQAETYETSNNTHLAVAAYNFKPRVHAGYKWQVHNPTVPENENSPRKWRKNWSTYITPEITTYNFSPTEGLTDIMVSVSNKTSQKLDYVQVKVLYLEKDGRLYKSEYAELFDVPANSNQQIPVYNSPSGEILDVYITNIVADAFGLAYSKDSYE